MRTVFASVVVSVVVGCSGSGPDQDCSTGKCDLPDGSVEEKCTNSRVPAMDEKRPHFTPAGVRWSCRDVNGVSADTNTDDDRGQEYCEYFSMLHTEGIPAVISDSSGPVFCDSQTRCETGVCDESISSCVTATSVDTSKPADILGKNLDAESEVTPLDPVLSAGQLDWLAQNPNQKIGECVFTSWHHDIDKPVASSERIGGYSLEAKSPNTTNPLFRMIVKFNSNGAAQKLVSDCLVAGDPEIKDGFMRGCTFAGETGAGEPFRKSDPSVCTMAMRMAECGCEVTLASGRKLDLSSEEDLQQAQELFVPRARRGFTLGTWDNMSALPTGCRYVRMGDSPELTIDGMTVTDPNADQSLVACNLNASHITASTAKDPKEACRTAYGEDVVVHVRAPGPELATLKCDTSRPKCDGAPWDFNNL